MNKCSQIKALQLDLIKSLVLKECGLSFDSCREKTLTEGLMERMAKSESPTFDDYVVFLNSQPEEMGRLVESLTVNETYFFREPAYLDLIVNRLIPDLLSEKSGKPDHGRIKILSAGCSTGEEPYSIAMMLIEKYGPEYAKSFSIVGIDIDSTVIGKAIKGLYGRHSFRGMDRRHLSRFFDDAGNDIFSIRNELRSMVSFQTMNLRSENYPAFMLDTDIMLYRNVSIYFPAGIQEEIFGKLSGCLKSGGYMVVSATETLHHNLGILSLLELDGLFVYRKIPATESEDRRENRRLPKRNTASVTFDAQRKKSPLKSYKNVAAVPKKDNSKKLFDDALELIKAGRQLSALSILDKAVDADQGFTNAHTLKASVLLNLHRLDEARLSCERALKTDRLCLAAVLMIGIIAHHQGDNDDCLNRLREAVYLDPGCWPAHFYLAEVAHIMGESRRATAAYRAALEILEKENGEDKDARFFPLIFNIGQFKTVCRHRLGLAQTS